jgi:hypothetical protein
MMQIKNEVLHVDTIDAVSEQLIGFIMREPWILMVSSTTTVLLIE